MNVKRTLRKAYIGLIMAFLYAPIVMLILYSFNNSKSRAQWGGFTLKWYRELFTDEAIMAALGKIDKDDEPVKEVRIL